MKILPEIKLSRSTKPTDDFKWAGVEPGSRPVGHRNKLGGRPDWVQQGHEVPLCPSCKKPSTFYGQLDSINDDVIIGDCGMIYVFLCFDCTEATAIAMC